MEPMGKVLQISFEKCTGCRLCFDACPVKAPQFGENTKMQKCNFCIHSIDKGDIPPCVATCPGGAIGFEIVDTSGALGGFAGFDQIGNGHGGQEANNGDHDHDFHQGETGFTMSFSFHFIGLSMISIG